MGKATVSLAGAPQSKAAFRSGQVVPCSPLASVFPGVIENLRIHLLRMRI